MLIKHDGQDGTFRPPVGSFRSFIDYFMYIFFSRVIVVHNDRVRQKKVADGKNCITSQSI